MGFLIDLVLGNLPAIIGGLGALFGVGWIYRKGRQHARAKADKELKNATDDMVEDLQDAARSGDDIDPDKLRDDDGFKRTGSGKS
jgi:hypothetical protein